MKNRQKKEKKQKTKKHKQNQEFRGTSLCKEILFKKKIIKIIKTLI